MGNLTKAEKKVAQIIEALDGGYVDPSEWVVENGKVYWANLDHEGTPRLTVQRIADFIKTYSYVFEDDL